MPPDALTDEVFRQHVYSDEMLVEIHAVDLQFTQKFVRSGFRHIIRAYTVEITENLRTDGGSLAFLARTVNFGHHRYIDLRGLESSADFAGKNRAPDGREPGTPGANGTGGAKGGNAGTLIVRAQDVLGSLHIDAKGRPGGAGQDGGHGAPGKNGVTGAKPGDRGGNGQPGGDAGVPGSGGDGGDGGYIDIAAINTPADDWIRFSVDGGDGGSMGQYGQPGDGGKAGAGGEGVVYE
jgi:hypothetical protein